MGRPKLDFCGFMTDVTSANYNAICNIYEGDSNVPLVGKECTSTIRNRAYKSIQNYAILTLVSMHSVFSGRLQCIIFSSTWIKRFLAKN